jgi:PAS domain-containing protein
VIGVAHVGSLTALAMANRATAAIHQHVLREAAESRARELASTVASLDALFESATVGFGLIDRELGFLEINEALAAINGRSVGEHLGHTIREVLGDANADSLEPVLVCVMRGEPVIDAELSAAPPSTLDRVRDFLPTTSRCARPTALGVGALVLRSRPVPRRARSCDR